jgi:hypothetical protein
MRLKPKKMAKPPVDSLSSTLPAHSASENTLTRNEFLFRIVKPRSVVNLTYLRILLTETQ